MADEAVVKAKAVEPEVLEKVDEKLVDEAAGFIHKTLEETVYRSMATIGEYLLEHFFDGDVEKVMSKAGGKKASFRALAERCSSLELPVSRTYLNSALWVAVGYQQLPAKSAFKQLPPSHQTTLLQLRDKDDFQQVEKLAAKAVSKGMSVRELREVVGEVVEKMPKAPQGRKPMPAIERALKTSLGSMKARGFSQKDLKELSDEAAEKALEDAQALKERVDELVKALKARPKEG